MAPSDRVQHHLDLGQLPTLIPPPTQSNVSTAASSPIDAPTSRLPGTKTGTTVGSNAALVAARQNSASPSHEYGSRFYPRRYVDLASLHHQTNTRRQLGPLMLKTGPHILLGVPQLPADFLLRYEK